MCDASIPVDGVMFSCSGDDAMGEHSHQEPGLELHTASGWTASGRIEVKWQTVIDVTSGGTT